MSLEVNDAQRPLLDLVATHSHAVLTTIKRDGRPQLSNVLYTWDPDTNTARISVTADRAKTRNAARDPRVSLHVSAPDFWSYAVVEGDAELSAVASDPHDAATDELVEVFRNAAGREHDDWEDFRRAMVSERRQVLRVRATHLYGMAQLP
ncbi:MULTISPECIES: PPOX class F420-dependent oxidoreductase [Rhodococcus]|jgi:PPOX class probable F420-dependent enzyme|uniref:PPOX class F420-dependent enzyme n=1 Tax=Rhodococcus oxybenzonivorans TaxID=1990687 RepID=A0A2S2C1H2_9NOCA|nr:MULTISPECIES: PPOX class F420-dependent oxidoreductase [Rhodococcus]AWK74737.1 PPOX class F420-dependent enzyme [Rhodococcus oxybenzonivorans]MDV7241429.1 PPOX class F420-dependent oxidoreductase [Rhodococcus oxybenzonivorans]MDV7267927.1 PPOX class F420-dependent oxidoreductase [Rhodococcus oxybenzonivorans]MDV7274038.1 PPOX class F420-dependent oxidoreductase [Rhodococcus oxybenzonivorans]MDV7333710.1 PPOX class F420-dependent oxidoreductase [Rhodococcus oxybenzonivorans]